MRKKRTGEPDRSANLPTPSRFPHRRGGRLGSGLQKVLHAAVPKLDRWAGCFVHCRLEFASPRSGTPFASARDDVRPGFRGAGSDRDASFVGHSPSARGVRSDGDDALGAAARWLPDALSHRSCANADSRSGGISGGGLGARVFSPLAANQVRMEKRSLVRRAQVSLTARLSERGSCATIQRLPAWNDRRDRPEVLSPFGVDPP